MYCVTCVYVSGYSVCDLNVYGAMDMPVTVGCFYVYAFSCWSFLFVSSLSRCVQYVVTGFLPAGTEALWQ